MISLQEVLSKTEKQLRNIRDVMDKGKGFHPEDASIYHDQSLADQYAIRETLRSVSTRQLIEFLGKGTTIGNYLVADKIHDDLVLYVNQTDLAPLINAQVVNGWQGADLIVNVVDDDSYRPHFTVGGATSPAETVKSVKCTLTPKTFTLGMPIGMDLEEDTGYALVDYHVQQAAKAVGRLSTDLMLNVLKNGSDGVGTANTEAGAADETNWLDIQNAVEANGRDEFNSNTMIVTQEAWTHSITAGSEIAGGAAGDFGVYPTINYGLPTAEFDLKFEMLDTKFCNSPELHAAMPGTDTPGGAMTNCVTLVFDRGAALLTGRKRWMQLENYVDPVRDIAGAVVSCRQDSVTLYKDACCTITET